MNRNLLKMSYPFVFLGGLTLSLILLSSQTRGQDGERLPELSVPDSIEILKSVLSQKQNELASLERMIDALNSVDSIYKIHYPTWMVIDEDLRQRVLRAFRIRHEDLDQDTAVVITLSPDRGEIVEISIGPTVMGRVETHRNLSDSLYNTILAGDYPLRRFSAVPMKTKKSQLFGSVPRVVSIDASLYGAALLFSNGWGFEAIIGNDEIGYPFWSTGAARVYGIFNRLKVGAMVPFKFGRKQPEILSPLDIRPRRLNGATGFAAEFSYPLGKDLVGVRLSIGELNKYVSGQLTDTLKPYYLHTVGQLYYSHEKSFGRHDHLFRLSGGIGFHQIALGKVLETNRIVAIEKSNFLSPLLKVEYMRHGPRSYGVGLQYYSSVLLLTGWLEIIRNFVYVDVRYYTPVLRDPKPWEQSYFVMISPRFRLAF